MSFYPQLDIFGAPSKEGIDVGYISSDRGYVTNVGVCEANEYAKSNPGTIFIVKNREKVQYLDINEVNELVPASLIPFSKTAGKSPAECSGLENVIVGNVEDEEGNIVPNSDGYLACNYDPNAILPDPLPSEPPYPMCNYPGITVEKNANITLVYCNRKYQVEPIKHKVIRLFWHLDY